MRIGEAYTFVPAAFGAEIGGKDTKTIPRRVTGHIEYINRAHRYLVGLASHRRPQGCQRPTSVAGGIKVQSGDCGMKKTSLKELRSFSKAELIRYVQYVEGEPLRAHHTAARTYIYELRLERVNKRYDAAIKELNALTQGPKTLQEFGEWIKVHETVSRCIAELERLEKLLYG